MIATGGFDPLHSGHLEYLEAAKELMGDSLLCVGVNSDSWLIRKKGKPFLPFEERFKIISAIRYVDFTIKFNDNDGSAVDCIKQVRKMFPKGKYKLFFCNGGDRTDQNIPEYWCASLYDVTFLNGVGGTTKKNSSSWILDNWIKS